MLRRTALVLALLLLTGCAARQPAPPQPLPEPLPVDQPVVIEPEPVPEPPPPPPEPNPLPRGAVEYRLGEGVKLRVLVAEGSMPFVKRAVQLLRLDGNGLWQPAGAVTVANIPGETVTFAREDLPGYPGAIVMEARRQGGVRHGAVALVDGKLVALDYHRLVKPVPEVTRGAYMFLNKYMNQIWVYQDGALAATYPAANGRDPWGTQPTWEDFKTNYKTPEGLFPIKSKIVNPPYNSLGGQHPPAEGGAPNNPLGTRWMGVEVLPGDGGGVWGFHGTYVPQQLGTWASEGCVRLYTPHAEHVYDLVSIGTMVRIVSGTER